MQKYIINIYTITKLKNRYGDPDISFGVSFFGEIGKFEAMPLPDEITDYGPYLDLKYKIESYEIDEEQEQEKVKFTL